MVGLGEVKLGWRFGGAANITGKALGDRHL